MSSWRISRSLLALRAEIDLRFPGRSKASDGSIGDAAHASRNSDHNPWIVDGRGQGVVSALDITDDDASGADMARLVEWLTKTSRDPRVKYVIHAGKIYSSYPTSSAPAWAARPYDGINAHRKHVHISVNSEPAHYDDGRPWGAAAAWAPKPKPKPAPKVTLSRMLREGSHGEDVRAVQRVVGAKVDGAFGPKTEAAVKAWQKARGLDADGIVGPRTARRMGFGWKG